MAQVPNITSGNFDKLQRLLHSNARVDDGNGNLIDITVRGPEQEVLDYLAKASLRIEVVTPDKARPTPDPADTQEQRAVPIPVDQRLDIEIQVVQTALKDYVVQVEVDPPIWDSTFSHCYYMWANRAEAQCTTQMNNPELELAEWVDGGYFMATNGGNGLPFIDPFGNQLVGDVVGPQDQGASGWWRLRVYCGDGNPCEYTLYGQFFGQGPHPPE
jgi:hypothetical protein